jgi:hypothetical protein
MKVITDKYKEMGKMSMHEAQVNNTNVIIFQFFNLYQSSVCSAS